MYRFALCLGVALAFPGLLSAQQVAVRGDSYAALPDAPRPQLPEAPEVGYSTSQAAFLMAESQTTQTPATNPGQTPDPPANETPEQRKARAEAELKAEESQRMFGVLPAFSTVYGGHAEPLTPGQKFELFFKGITDPYQFGIVAVDTAIQEGEDSYPGFNHGFRGLLRNYGAAYLDDFDGNLFGNAILPSLLHQDPRYYRLGKGGFKRRLIYSVETTVRCKGDNGKWQPNYSNVLGNLIGGAISNAYYPPENRGVGTTINHGLTVTAEGAFGALLLEFYPDIAQYMKHRHQRKLDRQAAAAAAPQG